MTPPPAIPYGLFPILQSIVLISLAALFECGAMSAEPIPVRYREGTAHGFLVLRTLEGKIIATGDLFQVPDEDQISSHLVFRFTDGSIEEENTVYSQRKVFRLISDHLIEKGPSFPDQVDMSLEMTTGSVTAHRTDGQGKEHVDSYHFDFPPDLANGMLLALLKNVRSEAGETKVSFLAPGSKPVLVKLGISVGGQDSLPIQGSPRKVNRFVVRTEIEGVPGLLVSIFGKQPPDSYVWILEGEAPAFIKVQTPAFDGGPIWITESTGPMGPNK